MTKINRLMLAVLAVCGSSAVLAQSSVNIYGRLNTTVEQVKQGGDKTTGMYNNASRIGFQGVEDLGGGLKAGFQLEAGFGSDDGSGPLNFGRQSELNLAGNFGMLRLGNFTAESYYATADFISMHNHDTGSSADALYFYGMRDVNKISYRTPVMGGFWVEAAHSFHEKANGAKNAWDLAANFNSGNLGLGLGYSNLGGATEVFGQPVLNGDAQQLAARASYTLGSLVLGGYYQYVKLDDVNGGNDAAKRHAYRLAAMYTAGASEFHANIGKADKVKLGGSKVNASSAVQWTLGYNYNLSKRTKVYSYYTKIDNKANAAYGVDNSGDNFSSFAVGVRHNF